MANRILYNPPDIILSSSIGEIDINADGDYIDVTLTAPGGVVILSERYYAHKGRVRLYDLSSIIEARMRVSGYTFADFRLSVYTDTPDNNADKRTLHILYCDRACLCNDIPMFLRENFLTTSRHSRVSPQAGILSALSVCLFAVKGESLEYTVFHTFRKKGSDSLYSNAYTMDAGKTASQSGIYQIEIFLESVIADAASYATTTPEDITPLTFTMRCGQRSATVYADPALECADTFFYLNCFNIWEPLTLPANTTAKTDIERAIANINGNSEFYDTHITKTYETETGPLSSEEADCVERLVTSPSVMRIEPNPYDDTDPIMLVPVLITDSTCEITDADDRNNRVKFTWRFADNRPVLRLSASKGTFTSPYDPTFS